MAKKKKPSRKTRVHHDTDVEIHVHPDLECAIKSLDKKVAASIVRSIFGNVDKNKFAHVKKILISKHECPEDDKDAKPKYYWDKNC